MTRLPPHAAFWLSIARLYLGAYWLIHGLRKLIFPHPSAVAGQLGHLSAPPGLSAQAIVAHTTTWLPIASTLEVVVGTALVLGVLTRLSAFGALVAAGAYFFASGAYLNYGGYAGAASSVMVLALLVLALPTGFGMNPAVDRRVRRVRPEFVEEPPFTHARAPRDVPS
ncbi:MAG: hypothetical protein DLM50_00990 [Candidatus Meridianibacter frigidus]|nr:MAG: hypothetical protein DLM50_00990 [Candidatus Eremiobacteraeota bacterium]